MRITSDKARLMLSYPGQTVRQGVETRPAEEPVASVHKGPVETAGLLLAVVIVDSEDPRSPHPHVTWR